MLTRLTCFHFHGNGMFCEKLPGDLFIIPETGLSGTDDNGQGVHPEPIRSSDRLSDTFVANGVWL